MKKGLLGAAVAALMVYGSTTARAASIDAYSTGQDENKAGVDVAFSITGNKVIYYFSYRQSNIFIDGTFPLYVDQINGNGSATYTKYFIDGVLDHIDGSINITNGLEEGSLTGSANPANDYDFISPFSAKFTFEIYQDPNNSGEYLVSSTIPYLGELQYNFVSLSLDVLAIPLPSPAPLFGAALLALAGIGWSAKRRQQQEAA